MHSYQSALSDITPPSDLSLSLLSITETHDKKIGSDLVSRMKLSCIVGFAQEIAFYDKFDYCIYWSWLHVHFFLEANTAGCGCCTPVPIISVAVRYFGRYLRELSHATQAAAAVAASIAEILNEKGPGLMIVLRSLVLACCIPALHK
ncbi:hypothetical protein L2E82_40890 [Cichorium intybus]|uniref:Uncharacterized protein n=1 Tax=Cichorium intybus TaxID=13427 RepID=A0ACB9AMV9_CICIN|nr:hypothetical protein L2E82_40890 [Cichorium intybus]